MMSLRKKKFWSESGHLMHEKSQSVTTSVAFTITFCVQQIQDHVWLQYRPQRGWEWLLQGVLAFITTTKASRWPSYLHLFFNLLWILEKSQGQHQANSCHEDQSLPWRCSPVWLLVQSHWHQPQVQRSFRTLMAFSRIWTRRCRLIHPLLYYSMLCDSVFLSPPMIPAGLARVLQESSGLCKVLPSLADLARFLLN